MASFLYRLDRFGFRRRWWVAVAWLVVLAATLVGAAVLSEPTQGSFNIPGTQSQKAIDLLAERFPQASAGGATARVVFAAPASSHGRRAHRRRRDHRCGTVPDVRERRGGGRHVRRAGSDRTGPRGRSLRRPCGRSHARIDLRLTPRRLHDSAHRPDSIAAGLGAPTAFSPGRKVGRR